jgi:hypothetical protein
VPDNAYLNGGQMDRWGSSTSPNLLLCTAIVLSIFLSPLLRQAPAFLFITIDTLFCFVIFFSLSSPWKFIVFLHPILILFFGSFYSQSFLEQGDGPAYEQAIANFLDTKNLYIDYDSWMLRGDILTIFKTVGFGVIPTYLIPDQISDNLEPIDYYYWQSAFHIILVSIATCFARSWKSVSCENLDILILYSAVGPSFFDLGLAPTRHFVTFFSVLLFFVSFMAATKSLTTSKVITIAISILLILISKAVLMGPLLLFVIVFFALKRSAGKKSTALIGITSALFGAIVLGPYLLLKFRDYAGGVAVGATGSMGYLVALPVVGQILKLLFALLSPFPWYKADYFVNFGYGGNWPLFIMHIASALIGMHLFISIAKNWLEIYNSADVELRTSVIFGLIMSASILGGATGFHTYILIYFPYLMLIIKEKRYQTSFFLAVLATAVLNILMAITGFGGAEA